MKNRILVASVSVLVIAALGSLAHRVLFSGAEPVASKPERRPSRPGNSGKPLQDSTAAARLGAARVDTKAPDWEAIGEALNSPDKGARWIALNRLKDLRSTRSVALLNEALDDPEAAHREEAARGIEAVVGYRLSMNLLRDPDWRPREIALFRKWWAEQKSRSVDELRLSQLQERVNEAGENVSSSSARGSGSTKGQRDR